MGFARTARFALAIIVAGVAAATVDAGGARPQRGVHVTAVVQLADYDVASMTNPYPPVFSFVPDGNVVTLYGGARREIDADGATSVTSVHDAGDAPAGCVEGDGSYCFISSSNGTLQLVRIGPDGGATSAPIDPGGVVDSIAIRDGRLLVLTDRYEPDRAAWLQSFSLDGVPNSPAVRVSPPEEPLYGLDRVDVDARGSAYVLWESATIDSSHQTHFHGLNWRRVDADGSVSPPVRVYSIADDTSPIPYWMSHLGPDGTTWVQPILDGSTDARGPVGIRRDGVVLPVIDLHARYDAATHASALSTFGVDAAGEVRTLVLPFGFVDTIAPLLRNWRPTWQRFGAEANPLRSRQLVEPSRPRRRLGRSGVWFQQMEVAPDGSSLIAVIRREDPDRFSAGNPGVLEFLHLGPDGRVLSSGSVLQGFQVATPRLTSTMVAGRPRFAITWIQRDTADGPPTAFVAILE